MNTQRAIAFKNDLDEVVNEIVAMLVNKNEAYGNSVFDPVRIFSKTDTLAQIDVRLDDKLSRLMRGNPDFDHEDVYKDILGYLLIREVAKRRQQTNRRS